MKTIMEKPIELDMRFKHHKPDEKKIIKYGMIRVSCRELADVINVNCPDSGEKSLALTNLEQVMFWANAAIARRESM